MKLDNISPERVFAYFEQICDIPRGSGDMEKISQFCMDFAKTHNLKAVRDSANNVVIFKDAYKGYEDSEPIILQGHLDMVCQKAEDYDIDFENDGIDIYADGDFVKAKGTTLGADNGIAVAMVLAILESDDIPHPALEVVFTTDEETGMYGAAALDTSILKSKRMINLDAEEDDILTVSCAGGSEIRINVPVTFQSKCGTKIDISLKGLKGGHSGVEIAKGRINADILAARLLNHMKNQCNFELISINGGDKGNAIPNCCNISIVTDNAEDFSSKAVDYLEIIKAEIARRENGYVYEISIGDCGDFKIIEPAAKDKFLSALLIAPNGVMQMSADIENLVETSLNLGILKTTDKNIIMLFTLRSNINSALDSLVDRMVAFADYFGYEYAVYGHYPSWEFKSDSCLQSIYKECYKEMFKTNAKVEAIHAGLECGLFSAKIPGLDCIAMGPSLYDVHTVNERLSISSTEKIYNLLIKILKTCL